MKRRICGLTALMMVLLFLSGAAADQMVRLPESSYVVIVPDGMIYDGPGVNPDDAAFALVDENQGLDIQFFRQNNDNGVSLQAMADVLIRDGYDAGIQRIGGVDMVSYRVTDPEDPPEKGMKCVCYVFLEGNAAQMICFWYGNQKAADLTEKIIRTIKKD